MQVAQLRVYTVSRPRDFDTYGNCRPRRRDAFHTKKEKEGGRETKEKS